MKHNFSLILSVAFAASCAVAEPVASSNAGATAFEIGVWEGIQLFGEEYEVNGLRIGFPYVASSSASGVGLALGATDCAGDFSGVQLTGFYNGVYGDASGVEFAFLGANYVDGSFSGLQGALIGNLVFGKIDGVQLALLTNLSFESPELTGGQISLYNGAGFIRGAQIGAINSCEELSGVQLGVINSSDTQRGLQFGLINTAGVQRGVQVGIVNTADKLEGVQIGIANIVRDAEFPVIPLVRANF